MEDHDALMEMIQLTTGQKPEEGFEKGDDNVDADLDWDADEELFKFARVEGVHGTSCGLCGPENKFRIRAAETVSKRWFEWLVLGPFLRAYITAPQIESLLVFRSLMICFCARHRDYFCDHGDARRRQSGSSFERRNAAFDRDCTAPSLLRQG